MRKITIIGAGGYVFPIRLSVDILSLPELQDSILYLHDINPRTLARNKALVKRIVARNALPTKVEAGTGLERALDGANYVIIAFQVGGVEAYKYDVEIPRRYGVDQCVGDTLGPGGVFRGLRTIKAFRRIADVMRRVCPDAVLLQYANPMPINTWALHLMGIKAVGLCHSVQGTSRMLIEKAKLPYDEVSFKCGGVNHQAWFTEFTHKGKDVYPFIREAMFKACPSPLEVNRRTGKPKARFEQRGLEHRVTDDFYYWELPRTEMMRTFGYFQTESSHHASEYVAWFRKNPRMVNTYIPRRWDYYQICCAYKEAKNQAYLDRLVDGALNLSEEYGARIIHSLETGTKRVIYGSVPNWGPPGTPPTAPASHVITNLPQYSCVETAVLVDRNGLQPVVFGDLPPQCAAINRQCINVQELTIKAAFTGERQYVHQAVAMDPLTGALLSLPQIRSMVDDMFRSEARWLPRMA
jgi:alpha-galactosidase